MLKQLLGNSFVQFLIGRAISSYMLLAGATTRWERVNEAAAAPFHAGRQKVIIGVWHGRILQAHKLWVLKGDAPKVSVLISHSREGAIVAETSKGLGLDTVRGSAAKAGRLKGGVEAMRAMARHIESGGVMCITPDGPRGPRMRVKPGAVHLARIAGAPLIGIAWASTRQRVMKSWDRMLVPLLFGRGVLIWSNPIAPPAPNANEAEIEAVRAAFEAEMNRIAAEADRRVGADVIAPAPVEGEPRAKAEAAPAP